VWQTKGCYKLEGFHVVLEEMPHSDNSAICFMILLKRDVDSIH